jgi:hypothetical protein
VFIFHIVLSRAEFSEREISMQKVGYDRGKNERNPLRCNRVQVYYTYAANEKRNTETQGENIGQIESKKFRQPALSGIEHQIFVADESVDDGDEMCNQRDPYIVFFISQKIIQENKYPVAECSIPHADGKEPEFLLLSPDFKDSLHRA